MLGSVLKGTDKWVRPSTEKAAHFTNRTKASEWETLAQRRTIARLRALFKALEEFGPSLPFHLAYISVAVASN